MALCEIRISTYRRPRWLERAIGSLLAQDLPDWRAVVFDDSPDREGEQVVRNIADKRIEYRPNPRNLGAAGNIDQCFQSGPVAGGAYACILEDDNWFYPGFLSSNVRALTESNCAIGLRNQSVWRQFVDRVERTEETTLGRYYSDGIYSPVQLCARLFLGHGISQGGLFWSLRSAGASLMVGPKISDPGLSETCRTLLITQPVVFRTEPQCAWAQMDESLCVRTFNNTRVYGRAIQSIRRYAVRLHGRSVLAEAARLAQSQQRQREFRTNRLDSFLEFRAQKGRWWRDVARMAKSAAKWITVRDRAGAFIRDLEQALDAQIACSTVATPAVPRPDPSAPGPVDALPTAA
ncbi:MAG TPA: glycosyltransferase family 2 protein [Tepidisphaeraceae bacterium]|nr:glycosyltransferase family 2 protein [Tepidisphaeraceae bacterium]